jgi:spore coat polysaccharide biosynthesis predicted glycosyltransferase SpsG
VTVRVGLRCDAGIQTGVGHMLRCVALAEELASRTVQVAFFGAFDEVPWARAQLASRGFARHAAPGDAAGLVAVARDHRLDAMVLDSYTLHPSAAGALRSAGVISLAIVDGDARGQDADLFLDQNLGAEQQPLARAGGPGRRLAGLRYVLLRDAVRAERPAAPPAPREANPPRVLCYAGGTDPFGAVAVLARLVVAAGDTGVDLTVVVARDELRAAVPSGPGISVIGPTDDLPRRAAGADLVVCAAGTSIWELLCVGTPAVVVWLAENQREGYTRTVGAGLAAGLGRLDDLRVGCVQSEQAEATLRRLLTGASERADLAARGWRAVDGQGRVRVADAVLSEVGRRAAAVAN